MSWRTFTTGWLPPIGVALVGAFLLLPGLGSFGLWEPPDSWGPRHERRGIEGQIRTPPGTRPQRALTELRIANRARRLVLPQARRKALPEEAAGVPRRPPLTREAVAAGFRVFGISEWAARVPIALFGILTLVLIYLLLWRLHGMWAGLAGAAILLGFPAFVLQSRQLTSEVVTIACNTAAVLGLGLLHLPARRGRWTIPAVLLGTLGLIGGFYARGVLIGCLLPTATVWIAVLASRRVFREAGRVDPRAGRRWIHGAIRLGVASAGFAALGFVALNQAGAAYSALLGEAPAAMTRTLNHFGIKDPLYHSAGFEVVFTDIVYATFPWIALLPVGLGVFLLTRSGETEASGYYRPEEREAGDRERFGRALLLSWAVVGLALSTYWVLRVGDLHFPALPALAGIAAVLLVDLGRADGGRMRVAAAVIAVMALAIVARDLGSFPQLLVSTHVDYQLQFPSSISLKWAVRLTVLAFGGVALLLLLCRDDRSPKEAGGSEVARALGSAGLGASRLYGLLPWSQETTPPGERREVLALVSLAVLALAAASMAYWFQRFPDPVASVVVFLAVWSGAPILPLGLHVVVDSVLATLDLAWRLIGRHPIRLGAYFFVPGDPLSDFFGRVFSLPAVHPLATVGLVILRVGILPGMLLLYGLRLFLRALGAVLLAGLAVALLPVTIFLASFGRRSTDSRWPPPQTLVVAGLPLISLLFAAWLAFGLTPRLSVHYSFKALIESYNRSRNAERPEPLLLHKVQTQSPNYYARGPVLTDADLRAAYAGQGSLLRFLKDGWIDAKGRVLSRVYAVIPAKELGPLDSQAYSSRPPVEYYVLDARNRFYVLISNRLGLVRIGGREVAEKDVNPLRELVRREHRPLTCKRGENAVCRRLSVLLHSAAGQPPALELIGAKYPKVIAKGQPFTLTLHFRVLAPLRTRYKVFVHIDGMNNRIQGDHDPVGDKFATSLWRPGHYIIDRYRVPAGASPAISTPSGPYTVYVGLFTGSKRMYTSRPHHAQDRINLGRVQVTSSVGGCLR